MEVAIHIHKTVKDLVEKYGTHNPYELVKKLDICLCIGELPEKVRGIYTEIETFLGTKKAIGLNQKLSESNRKIVLCHELGHAVLHPGKIPPFIMVLMVF
ncbi:ImmA/IrrE family metallo-endopeptidase [Selenomonadales bacterium OttesenSCG-928-I06]|nr:ImmA/IrrE family metallo-endopeptidase [Selenomonadales bacterium OttesenSCG-928-I06]